jgi:UDP-N-acetylmuramoylalanine-D-glutamate ligase
MAYNIKKFKSDYGIFTNFELDHLNWHKDMQDYLDAKLNIFKNTTKKSIINNQVFQKTKELGLKIKLHNSRIF